MNYFLGFCCKKAPFIPLRRGGNEAKGRNEKTPNLAKNEGGNAGVVTKKTNPGQKTGICAEQLSDYQRILAISSTCLSCDFSLYFFTCLVKACTQVSTDSSNVLH